MNYSYIDLVPYGPMIFIATLRIFLHLVFECTRIPKNERFVCIVLKTFIILFVFVHATEILRVKYLDQHFYIRPSVLKI